MSYTQDDAVKTIAIVRPVLEQITHKWCILILTFLCEEPKRFSALKRELDGITQKALTETLRRLEKNGLVDRSVTTASPISVTYSITPLGRTLQGPYLSLLNWAMEHRDDLQSVDSSSEKKSSSRQKLIPFA